MPHQLAQNADSLTCNHPSDQALLVITFLLSCINGDAPRLLPASALDGTRAGYENLKKLLK
jgi:hypothetical protein